jgi:hypothetical protein
VYLAVELLIFFFQNGLLFKRSRDGLFVLGAFVWIAALHDLGFDQLEPQ